MRAVILAGLVLLAASAAAARPLSENQPIVMPSQDVLIARLAIARARAGDLSTGRHPGYVPSAGGFAIGPFRADATDTISGIGRRHAPKPRYRLEGVTLFGGSIGGSVDGRGAMLSLHWTDGH